MDFPKQIQSAMKELAGLVAMVTLSHDIRLVIGYGPKQCAVFQMDITQNRFSPNGVRPDRVSTELFKIRHQYASVCMR